ncbi:dynein regulatory complex subunit 3-like [Daktulosphaira vitifoliae]|uniref:dynein regulatory complex subunit 3-like n=1 Tax=Daktulosphaira vitifoliae TaxID=58002 RepID=UPI0021A99410|nr:dynein regulatory complex subunit 3-like [Daktulosphaira vitifoliae]
MDLVSQEKLYKNPIYKFYDFNFIISSVYIKEHFLKNQSNEEISRLLSLEPHFNWDIIVKLDLSMKGVLHITGLRLPTNLRHLKITQNHIRKIENLDSLIKLEYLDLSFNKINKIENLDHLTNLTLLNLAGNLITEIENLDCNVMLETLFINDNRINDINNFLYLKRFKKLICIDVSNNPATSDIVNSRYYILCRFPQLHYLNGEYISYQERLSAGIIEPKVISKIKSIDLAQIIAENAADERNKEIENHKLAFVEDLDGESFIDYLYKNDPDGKQLKNLNSEVKLAYDEYKKNMTGITMEIFQMGKENLLTRNKITEKFHLAYYIFEKKWTNKNRTMISDFENIRYFRVQSLAGKYKENELVSADNMNKSIAIMISRYEKNLEDILRAFIEPLVDKFAELREIENDYAQILSETIKMITNNPDSIDEYVSSLNYFGGDRFAINQATYKSTDKHMDAIYTREEKLNLDIKNWTRQKIDNLKKKEKKRYLMVCEEIANYREMQKQCYSSSSSSSTSSDNSCESESGLPIAQSQDVVTENQETKSKKRIRRPEN